jgi:hypothetical protein
MELQAFGISVCMIEPGDFKTSIDQNRLEVVLGEDSPYGGMSAAVEEIANLQVKKAAGPALMGPTIYKIIHSRKRRLRYKIGSPTEKLSVLLKKVLPGRMFEKIILGYYKS